jgi:hypothetical protein
VDIAKRLIERLEYIDFQIKGTYKMWYAMLPEGGIPQCESDFLSNNMEVTVLSKDPIIASNMIQLLSMTRDKCYKNLNFELKQLTQLINEFDIEGPLTISMLMEVLYEKYDQASYLYSMDIDTTFDDLIRYYNNVTGKFEYKKIKMSLSTIDAWTLKRISNEIKSL